MVFEEFKKQIIEGLRDIYGDDTEIETGVAFRNNGSKYNGISIRLKDAEYRTVPVIDLDRLYRLFENGMMKIEDCVWDIFHDSTNLSGREGVEEFAENISDWECVKNDIYPILLSTEENQELLKNLVTTPMLDLSVAYTIRGEHSEEGIMSVKITTKLLEYYGMSVEQLHKQAMENLEKDGYEFLELQALIKNIRQKEGKENEQKHVKPEMYVLTNSAKSYGAAGILNKKLLREFAGKRDFIILPSSVHETLFVPVTSETDKAFYDDLVSKVNEEQVRVEEKLADHSYYYDAKIGEIRMCA